MVTEPTVEEYLSMVALTLRELLDWRERWDQRTPAEEPALRAEWRRLADRSNVLMASPVFGELDDEP